MGDGVRAPGISGRHYRFDRLLAAGTVAVVERGAQRPRLGGGRIGPRSWKTTVRRADSVIGLALKPRPILFRPAVVLALASAATLVFVRLLFDNPRFAGPGRDILLYYH